jgi:hypothetical protein
MEADKNFVIYCVQDGIKWYYANCFFKPFMPGLINAFLYRSRESAEKACRAFGNSKNLSIIEN